MRNRFPGYYTPSADEFKTLWEQCLFVPDANILLHLFRYGPNTTSQVLDTLERLKPRVWIPYRVGYEFHRRWREVDQANRDAYDKLSRDIEVQGRKLSGLFDEYTRHQTIDAKREQEEIAKFLRQFSERIQASKQKHPTFDDAKAVFEKLSDLVGEAVGQSPTDQQLADLMKEGKRRYEAFIPPGFRDGKKEGADVYGDYFIWQEALDKAKTASMPIIIITDDVKEDWWLEFRGQKIGPRPELVAEMKAVAGQQFHLYTLSQFLDHATNFLNQVIDPAAIQEIKQDEVQLRKAATAAPPKDLRVSLYLDHCRNLRSKIQSISASIKRLSDTGTPEAFQQIDALLDHQRALHDEYRTASDNLKTLDRGREFKIILNAKGLPEIIGPQSSFSSLEEFNKSLGARLEAARRKRAAAIEDLEQLPDKDHDEGEVEADE